MTFPLPETLSVSTTEPAIQRRPVHPSRTQQPTEPDVVPDPKTVRFPTDAGASTCFLPSFSGNCFCIAIDLLEKGADKKKEQI